THGARRVLSLGEVRAFTRRAAQKLLRSLGFSGGKVLLKDLNDLNNLNALKENAGVYLLQCRRSLLPFPAPTKSSAPSPDHLLRTAPPRKPPTNRPTPGATTPPPPSFPSSASAETAAPRRARHSNTRTPSSAKTGRKCAASGNVFQAPSASAAQRPRP